MTIARRGALFSLGTCAPDDLSHFITVLNPYPKQIELLQGIFDSCRLDPERRTDIVSLSESLNIGRSTILQRVERLQKLRLITSNMEPQPGLRARTVYTVQLPDGALLPMLEPPGSRVINASTELPGTEQTQFEFDPATIPQVTQLHYHPDLNRRMVWKGERFSIFSLLAGLRIGRTGTETRKKHTRIYLGPRWFELEVEAVGDEQIASVLDLRVLIVISTLLREHLLKAENPGDPSNGFVISMTSLCDAMRMESLPGNKRYLFQQLKRWNSSRFCIRRRMNNAVDWATGFATGDYFFFISRILVLESLSKEEGATPEELVLFMDKRIIDALPDTRRSLAVHPEILIERKPRPFMHLMYYWCRRVVMHEWEPCTFSLEHLRRELRPNMTPRRFRSELAALMREQKIGEDGLLAKLPGYFVRYLPNKDDPDDGQVMIWADPQDPLLGKTTTQRLTEVRRTLLERVKR